MARLLLVGLFLPVPTLARDNVLVIVADDVGVDGINVYSRDDLYGHAGEGASAGPSPNIDQLAAEGVLFRNAYTNPVCAPTRAEALTGRHGFRTEIGVPERAILSLDETIIPELLPATYRTAAIGKWHLGGNNDLDHPIDSGFEYYAGGLGGSVDDYYSWDKTTNSSTTSGFTQSGFDTYATTDAADEAIAKIAEFGEEPWFVWLAFNAPHTPFHVPPAGLTTIAVDAASDNSTKFKAAVEAMDMEIGRVLASIPQSVLDDTTIIFLGDNGTPAGASDPPFSPPHAKGSMYEGGINVPFIVAGPQIGAASQGSESLALMGSVDLVATIAEIVGVVSSAEDSVSFLPYLADPARSTLSIRPYVYAERFEPNGPGPYTDQRKAARDSQYKLIWRNGTYEEFFDLDADPFESSSLLPVSNLGGDERTAYDGLVEAIEQIEQGVISQDASCPPTADGDCAMGFEKGSIDWKDQGGVGDRLKVKMQKGPALTQTDFGNPIDAGGTAYGLCVYDDADLLAAELNITRGGDLCHSGKECWKAVGGDPPDGKGYKYKDKDELSHGISKVTLKGGDAGKSQVKITGRGENLPDGVTAALLGTSSVTIQLRGSDATQCLSTTLADISKRGVDRFKAK